MCTHCVRADRLSRATRDHLWRLLVAIAGSEERARQIEEEVT